MTNLSHEIGKEDLPCASDGALPEEQNIQNQDISADAGVVTRYTCVIATVASADETVPAMPIDGTRIESGTSLSSSSPPSQLWPHLKSTDSDITTTEDEIRRHNMLQQSLVRQLQNERTMLNDHHAPVVDQSGNFNQSNSFNHSLRFQSLEAPKSSERPQLPKKPEPPRRLDPPRKLEPLSGDWNR